MCVCVRACVCVCVCVRQYYFPTNPRLVILTDEQDAAIRGMQSPPLYISSHNNSSYDNVNKGNDNLVPGSARSAHNTNTVDSTAEVQLQPLQQQPSTRPSHHPQQQQVHTKVEEWQGRERSGSPSEIHRITPPDEMPRSSSNNNNNDDRLSMEQLLQLKQENDETKKNAAHAHKDSVRIITQVCCLYLLLVGVSRASFTPSTAGS